MKPDAIAAVPATALVKVADTPRDMGVEERRIIFAKLNEVYLDATKGYSADWTDAKVAKDLGVPKAWVTTLRDQFLGPAKTNEEVEAALREIETLRLDLVARKAEIDKIDKDFRQRIGAVADQVVSISAKIDRQIKKMEQAA